MKIEGLFSPLRKMLMEMLSLHQADCCQISITFVGRDKIKALNRDYLGRRGITDVISFDLSGPALNVDNQLIGDVYICVPRARQQAKTFQVTLTEELIRLSAHGVLHLLGYDHECKEDACRMFALQEKMVSKYAHQTN